MTLATAFTAAGQLADWLRSHHRMNETRWQHALLADGSIHSFRMPGR